MNASAMTWGGGKRGERRSRKVEEITHNAIHSHYKGKKRENLGWKRGATILDKMLRHSTNPVVFSQFCQYKSSLPLRSMLFLFGETAKLIVLTGRQHWAEGGGEGAFHGHKNVKMPLRGTCLNSFCPRLQFTKQRKRTA